MSLRILSVHNYYKHPGGEDVAFESEVELLRRHGHEVATYVRQNRELDQMTVAGRLGALVGSVWSRRTYDELLARIGDTRPNVVHFHNTFPLISPSGYAACRRMGVPVVQALDNPRLLCPAATQTRNGEACQLCADRSFPWPGVVHRCYRGSMLATASVAAMLASHKYSRTWWRNVDVFAVASPFVLGQFKAYGIPPNRLFLKPHFVWPDSTDRTGDGEFALFVGRLAEEKGVNLLRDAWASLAVPLRIRGDGPELLQLQAAFEGRDHVSFVPHAPPLELAALFRRARFLVWPSLGLYETFGLVAAEAFARRIPVMAADAGAMRDMVEDGVTGLRFRSGDAEDLRAKVAWAWDHPREMRMMGDRAFSVYEQRYSAESGYARLMQLYEAAQHRETSSRS